ncbi:D-galactarate dehydratase [Deltaproteobacteria bacterium]|nr:D-galactarate dehydratase [Deltaproteobacteria bacterium]
MPALKVHDADNVATVFEENVTPGAAVEIRDQRGATCKLTAKGAIAYGHKIATRDIPIEQPVVKYGEIIGSAARNIEAGDHVHVHNLDSLRGRGDLDAGI